MDKNGEITIGSKEFLAGISNSRYTGFEHMRNLDPFSKRGSLRIMPKMIAETDTDVPDALIEFSVIDPRTGYIYFATGESNDELQRWDGSSWINVVGATTGVCRGLVLGNDYIFRVLVSGSNMIVDRYGPLSSSPSWSTNWGTIRSGETSTRVPTIYGQDDVLYFGIKNKVSSISDVTSSGSINTNALDLPKGYEIQSFAELGANLMIGATIGDSVSSVGDIFPWDRVSSSFNLPIQTGLQGIPIMYTKNNLIYAIGGKYGQLFITNGTTVQQEVKFSELTDDPEVRFRNVGTDVIDAWNSGIVLGFGKSAGTDNGPCGVWIMREGSIFFQTLSFGQVDTDGFDIGSVIALDEYSYLVAWADFTGANTFGVDVSNPNKRYTSYQAYFDSMVYQVGTKTRPRTFQGIYAKFSKPLESNQGLKISYRTDSSSNYTEIDAWEYGDGTGSDNDNLGGIICIEHTPMNIPACQSIQFRVALTCDGDNSDSPELEYIKIY